MITQVWVENAKPVEFGQSPVQNQAQLKGPIGLGI